jgi:hypothetical protein
MDGERGLSCRVLIILEDPTNDQHILRPLVARLLKECGKPNAKWSSYKPAVSRIRGRLPKLAREIRKAFRDSICLYSSPTPTAKTCPKVLSLNLKHEPGPKLLCCAAVEEVEAWLLAGHINKLDRSWAAVRADTSVKENVFAPSLRDCTAIATVPAADVKSSCSNPGQPSRTLGTLPRAR